LPRDLGRIVRRALLKDPDRRYQTAKDLRSDLEELKASLESGEVASPSATSAALPATVKRTFPRWAIPSAVAVAALVVAGTIYILSTRRAGPTASTSASAPFSLDDLQITQLTTTGNAERPAISADGKYVAYVQRDGDTYSLWIRQTATSSNVQIVAPEPGIRLFDPTVTPDGNYVDFVRGTPQSRSLQLWRVPFLGGTPKRIVENLTSTVGWSHDGRRMAFIRADIGATGISTALVVAEPDGSDERVVTTRRVPSFFPSLANSSLPVRPAWSADDASIALLGRDGTGGETRMQIVLVDVTSGSERVLPVDGQPQALGWLSADSLVMVRQTDTATPRQLWRYTIGDGKMSRLTNDLNDYTGFGLSADGGSLVTAQSETQVRLWIGDGSGAQGSEPLPAGRGGGALAWAADSLVYITQVNRVPTMKILAPGRAAPEDVVSKARTPSASADGRTIVFVSADTGADRGLWKVAVDGSRPVHLWSETATNPIVTSGDRQVVFLSDRSGQQSLWTIPIDGGEPRQLSPVFAGAADVASNGTSLVFGSFDDQRRPVLMLCELPECQPRQMTLPTNFGGGHRWMPGGRAIAYLDQTRRNLWVQPLDGGAPRQLTHFSDAPTITSFAWSRDGKRLAIARATTTNDIVLFTGLKR
jgi:Tol biopolymer transport system component